MSAENIETANNPEFAPMTNVYQSTAKKPIRAQYEIGISVDAGNTVGG